MKTLKWMLILAAVTMTAVACGPKKENKTKEATPKMLVLFYSQTSNTRTVAKEIADRLGADIEEILPVTPFDGGFDATIQRCKKEREEGIVTEIQPITSDLAQYDVIFIGYPVWFGTYAPPVATFLGQVDLSGKKVVPFCTFGSGGLESSSIDLAKAQPKATILPGYGVRAARLDAATDEIKQFLLESGFLKGDYTPLPEFSEQHEVSEAEAAIFNAAVGDYPMIHAEAKTASSRALPNGVEYLFIAADLPREGRPDMPLGEIKVYVTVIEDQVPVFTKVVR